MAEIQRISVNTQHTKKVFETYQDARGLELLTVLSDNNIIKPEEQNQTEHNISFDTRVVANAKNELLKEGADESAIEVTHQHEAKNGHGFGFSEEDLSTAKKLKETQGIDRMGLVMNGNAAADGSMVQHKIVANSDGELHTLEGDEGEGKVITMYTDEKGTEKISFSESIEEAEQKQKLIEEYKKLLFEEPDMTNIIGLEEVLQAA